MITANQSDVVVVKRGDIDINYFPNLEEAKQWIQDMYGERGNYLLTIEGGQKFGESAVVKRGDTPVMTLNDYKAAGAWMQHVFGMTPWDGKKAGIRRSKNEICTHTFRCDEYDPNTPEELKFAEEWQHIWIDRLKGPVQCHKVVYGEEQPLTYCSCNPRPIVEDGKFYHYGNGIIDHSYGRNTLSVCFSASGFLADGGLSCSGGPIPSLNPEDLTFEGLDEVCFWRWHDGSGGANKAGYFPMTVPVWRWNGNPYRDVKTRFMEFATEHKMSRVAMVEMLCSFIEVYGPIKDLQPFLEHNVS